MPSLRLFPLGLILGGALVAACNSSESTGSGQHKPDRANLVVGSSPMLDDTLRIPFNTNATVRVIFYDGNTNLDKVEMDHFSSLTFTPSTGFTVTPDPTHHYRHVVNATSAPGTVGTVDIGFGHDAAADEATLHFAYKIE